MKITLDRAQLDEMQKHSKLYTHLSTTLTRSYFSLGDDKFTIFFQGSKGACKTTIPVQCPDAPIFFQADYSKLSNALSKVGFSPSVTFSVTAKQLRISIDGSSDVISLAIISYPASSSEATTITSYIENKLAATNDKLSLLFGEELMDALTAAASMFTTVGKNNAIAVRADYVLYADRSIVMKARLTDPLPLTQETVLLHKYILNTIQIVQKTNPLMVFSSDYSTLYWSDTATNLVLASEPCDIAIPSEDDLKAIAPNDGGTLTVEQHVLQQGLAFFNGFYEASVWKPITFRIADNGAASLYYKHPTTEISKDLGCSGSAQGEFVVASETLAKLVSKSIELSKDTAFAILNYDDVAPGVLCSIGELCPGVARYEVILGKLVE